MVIIDNGRMIADGSVRELIAENGGSLVELVFDGPPPTLNGFETVSDGSVIRVSTNAPGRAMGPIFSALGPEAERLQSVEVINSSLETVFLQLAGRRYEPEDGLDVMAS